MAPDSGKVNRGELKATGSRPAAGSHSRAVLRPSDFRSERIQVDDLWIHAAVEGPEHGPLIVLLHGFPEFWYSWRYQIKALAAAGCRRPAWLQPHRQTVPIRRVHLSRRCCGVDTHFGPRTSSRYGSRLGWCSCLGPRRRASPQHRREANCVERAASFPASLTTLRSMYLP
jgi:hypothetical protein